MMLRLSKYSPAVWPWSDECETIAIIDISADRDSPCNILNVYSEEDKAARNQYQHQGCPTTINTGDWKGAIYSQANAYSTSGSHTPCQFPTRGYQSIVRRSHGRGGQWMEEEAQGRSKEPIPSSSIWHKDLPHHQLADS